ncbi:uncharacterized protein K452DRAFT_283542, partial [Aplosporella prunicola CBS 121167]
MDTTDLKPLIEDLSDNIDDLEDALGPLLHNALSASTSKLPLLDKAKLYALLTYAIESILFSYLNLNGVKAKEHPVFTELTRVKQYFQKIAQVESAPVQRTQTLDKAAANRFIKHGLAGNDKYDQDRALQQAKERAIASLKLEQLNKKRKADETEGLAPDTTASAESSSSESESEEAQEEAQQPKKKKRTRASDMWKEEGKAEKKEKKKAKKGKKHSKLEEPAEKAQGHKDEDDLMEDQDVEETIAGRKSKSSRVPLGHKAAFEQLVKGPIQRQEEPSSKKSKSKKKAAK